MAAWSCFTRFTVRRSSTVRPPSPSSLRWCWKASSAAAWNSRRGSSPGEPRYCSAARISSSTLVTSPLPTSVDARNASSSWSIAYRIWRRVAAPAIAVAMRPAKSKASPTTIRARILVGLALLLAGLIATAIAGAATLRQMRYAIETELDALRTSTEVGSGLVTSVLEEIRAAEQYLGSPGDDPRREFQAAAEDAFQHQRRLDALGGLTVEDRLTVNRVKQLHAAIQTEYSIAHALRDLGRDQEAAARAAAVRPQAAELTRLVRDLSQRQAQKAAKAAQRLSADAADRERKLWVFVVALVIAGFFLS